MIENTYLIIVPITLVVLCILYFIKTTVKVRIEQFINANYQDVFKFYFDPNNHKYMQPYCIAIKDVETNELPAQSVSWTFQERVPLLFLLHVNVELKFNMTKIQQNKSQIVVNLKGKGQNVELKCVVIFQRKQENEMKIIGDFQASVPILVSLFTRLKLKEAQRIFFSRLQKVFA